MAEPWLKCSACRKDIAFGEIHWVCSVSTCNRKATRYVFDSVACWDSHVAMLRHRDAWAVEARAPTAEAWARELAAEAATPPARPAAAPTPAVSSSSSGVPRRIAPPVAPPLTAGGSGSFALANAESDMLIVISKLKKYIKERAGMNCSDAIADILSDHVRAICDDAIRAAGRDERKTVLERDIPRPRRT